MIASKPTMSRASHLFWYRWLPWVATSTAAILLGFVLLFALLAAAKAIIPGINEDRLLGWMLFPGLGILLGTAQWIILRRHLSRAGWWIPATAGGWTVVIAVGALATRVVGVAPGNEQAAVVAGLLSTLVVGLLLGVLQLPILHRTIRWSSLWIFANAAGWLTLGLAIGKSIDKTADIVALGAIPAAFTGLALCWLWRE